MNRRVQDAIEAAVAAIEGAVRETRSYRADPHGRRTDREAALADIAARRDRAVSDSKATITGNLEGIEKTYGRLRASAFDEVAIASAWGRVEPLLDSGRGVDDIVERTGFSRDEAEALRRNYPTWLAVQMPTLRPVDVERRAQAALEAIERAEMRLMDSAERQATQDELGRRRTLAAVAALDKLAVEAQTTGRVGDVSLLALGHAMQAAGAESDGQTWHGIERAVNGRMADAERERNSATADVKSMLDGRFTGLAAEPSLKLPVG